MTDATQPPSEQPASSVVIDEHATVHVKRWPIWVALGGVLAFIAFSAIWFAVDSDDPYEPGPPAQALLDAAAAQGIDLEASDAELKCVDRVGKDVDPAIVVEAFEPVTGDSAEDQQATLFAGKVLGECLERPTRINLLVQGMVADESVTEDQARCVAGALDDAIVHAGGWEKFAGDEQASSGLFLALFAAYDSCGVDPFGTN